MSGPRSELRRLLVLLAAAGLGCATFNTRALAEGEVGAVRANDLERKASVEFFETHIRPVLAENCYECHSAKKKSPSGSLRLDTAAGWQAGGDSGPAIVPGKPEESLLVSAVRYESHEMPPKGRLSDGVIADIEHWIAGGAVDPRAEEPASAPDPQAAPARHWSLVRPTCPTSPAIEGAAPIDAFVTAKLSEAHLTPSPEADPRTLLRRLSYALTGLPPTAEELDAYAASKDAAKYEQAVDRLLASPQFGERWGRYWLDVARYADTKGYLFTEDRNYRFAYKYRDWVVKALNDDLPYDRFVVAQIAGDKLDDPAMKPALGYLTLGRRFLNNSHDIIDDRIDVVTRGFMGLTVACARCHDHKYDPIPTADYYALYGVFASSVEKTPEGEPPILEDAEKPVAQVVFLRGQPGNPGPAVTRHFLSCLADDISQPQQFASGSGRLELARAIASPTNPLTARVWVNRVWARLFGRGLVATPSDFGVRGEAPSHPDLLDWLACSFIDEGWSTKKLIRQIVTSRAFRQTSAAREDGLSIDPENRLLWRMNRQRLDLESFRDSLLAAASRLDRAVGGPPVQLTEMPYPTRRAVYGFIERQNLPSFFRTFDFANPNSHVASRVQTASPQQALFFLNSDFAREQAYFLAARAAAITDRRERVNRMYRAALGRNQTDEEFAEAEAFVAAGQAGDEEAWADLAQVLLMSNEFMFVD